MATVLEIAQGFIPQLVRQPRDQATKDRFSLLAEAVHPLQTFSEGGLIALDILL